VSVVAQADLVASTNAVLPVQLRDARSQRPLAGTILSIHSVYEPLNLTANEEGWLDVPVSADYLDEDPAITHNHKGKVTFTYNLTGRLLGGRDTKEVRWIDIKDLPRLQHSGLLVFFDPASQAAAGKAMQELERQREFTREFLGLEPVPWSVVVVPRKEPGVQHVVLGIADAPSPWCYSETELTNGTMAHVNVHEWVETTLDRQLGLYAADRSNRFIGDGLAELGAFRWAGLPSGYAKGLETPMAKREAHVDILARFRTVTGQGQLSFARIQRALERQIFPPGYPLSFVFWLRLSDAHGADLPRRFVAWFQRRSQRDHRAALEGLRALTSEQNLEDRLRRANVAEASRILAALQP
jgi:hypothetical protein